MKARDVLVAITFVAVALLALLVMLSTGYNSVTAGGSESKATDYARQEMEFLRRVAVADPRFANGNDTPEPGVSRAWMVAGVGTTVTPNRLWPLSVTTTVRQTGSAAGSPGLTLETMHAE